MNIKNSACFTGHRSVHNPDEIRQKVTEVSYELIEKGVNTFLIGGAYGFDMLAGEEIVKIRDVKPEINLTVVLPCEFANFTLKWSMETKQRLNQIMMKASKIIALQDSYSQDCYKKRNKYLIDNSSYCICYYDKEQSKSGTGQTVRMAINRGMEVINIF